MEETPDETTDPNPPPLSRFAYHDIVFWPKNDNILCRICGLII